jgi:hypothetical protein
MGDPAAPTFDPRQDGPHFMLFLNEDGSVHPLNDIIPAAWRPKRAGDVQLVVCTGKVMPHILEQCLSPTHFGPHRVVPTLRATVVAVRSGALDKFSIAGSEPSRCPPVPLPDAPDLMGGFPTPDQVKIEIVDRYVPLPSCGGGRPYAACLRCYRDSEEASSYTFCGAHDSTVTLDAKQPVSVRPGDGVTLAWIGSPINDNSLYAATYDVDWQASPSALLLDTLDGSQVTATPQAPGVYNFVAEAGFVDHGQRTVTNRQGFTVNCLE